MLKMNVCASVFIGVLIMTMNAVYADQSNPHQTVERFLQALKQGDIETIGKLIDGDYYRKNKKQIDNNPTYSDFLKRYYQNSEFRIVGTVWNKASVFTRVEKSDNGNITSFSTFRLEKDSNNIWKIMDEKLE